MTRAGGGSARFRQRKLSTKQSLQILHEDQVEKIDDEQQRNIPKVDTGVEKAEEIVSCLSAWCRLPASRDAIRDVRQVDMADGDPRNITCKRLSRPRKRLPLGERLPRSISQPLIPSIAASNMTVYIPYGSRNRQRIYASPRRSRNAAGSSIV